MIDNIKNISFLYSYAKPQLYKHFYLLLKITAPYVCSFHFAKTDHSERKKFQITRGAIHVQIIYRRWNGNKELSAGAISFWKKVRFTRFHISPIDRVKKRAVLSTIIESLTRFRVSSGILVIPSFETELIFSATLSLVRFTLLDDAIKMHMLRHAFARFVFCWMLYDWRNVFKPYLLTFDSRRFIVVQYNEFTEFTFLLTRWLQREIYTVFSLGRIFHLYKTD